LNNTNQPQKNPGGDFTFRVSSNLFESLTAQAKQESGKANQPPNSMRDFIDASTIARHIGA